MTRKEEVYQVLRKLHTSTGEGVTAEDISKELKVHRSNISYYLNRLYEEGLVEKIKSRPVYFVPLEEENATSMSNSSGSSFSTIIGKTHSLKDVIEKTKAAILYPPYGLHTIIYGETGVGKSMLAEQMYRFSIELGIREEDSPFVTFNCADYANNPQLLMGHIFGVEKGAYTGADRSRAGLLEIANGGILFLDEIHRLSPEGQEMLFTFIDKGIFKRMGQSAKELSSQVLIIGATTEDPQSTLLDTFNRRIPMTIRIPPLRERSLVERIELIKHFFRTEAKKVNLPIKVHRQIMKSLLLYECKNNVGQLQNDIKLAVANSYLNCIRNAGDMLNMSLSYFGQTLIESQGNHRGKAYQAEILIPKDLDYYIFYPSGKEENLAFKEDKDSKNDDRIKMTLVREGIRSNVIIEELFMDPAFLKVCEKIKDIIERELSIILSERKFNSLAIYLNSIIGSRHINGATRNMQTIDINQTRQKYRDEFRVALKVIDIIENDMNILLSLEDAAHIALFISEDEGLENLNRNIGIIVAMHGDSTASSMVKAVKDILGESNLYSFDMKLNKSYKEVVIEFKDTIKTIRAEEGILLLTDMGSLNSFHNIVQEQLDIPVRTVPMVTTLMVLEAVQKAGIGYSLTEIYNSVIDMRKYNLTGKAGVINRMKKGAIIISYQINEGVDKKSKLIIKDKLMPYIEDVETIFVPYSEVQDLLVTINNLMEDNDIIALIGKNLNYIEDVEYIERDRLNEYETIFKLKELIKINRGYYDIVEGLKSSLKYTNYSIVFDDTKTIVNRLFEKLNITKQYDIIIGFMMHIAFMIDALIGGTRPKYELRDDEFKKHKKAILMVKEEFKFIEEKYDINIGYNECYDILNILYGELNQ